jgi:hypothetical protein
MFLCRSSLILATCEYPSYLFLSLWQLVISIWSSLYSWGPLLKLVFAGTNNCLVSESIQTSATSNITVCTGPPSWYKTNTVHIYVLILHARYSTCTNRASRPMARSPWVPNRVLHNRTTHIRPFDSPAVLGAIASWRLHCSASLIEPVVCCISQERIHCHVIIPTSWV